MPQLHLQKTESSFDNNNKEWLTLSNALDKSGGPHLQLQAKSLEKLINW